VNLDITDRGAVVDVMERLRPDIIIHGAAMTDVDDCERDPETAYRLNRDGTSFLVGTLPESARLVYISTDQVYPDRPGPHREETTDPVNVYAKSKLAGEVAALVHPGTLVLRTNVFGPSKTPGRSSLSDFVIHSLTEGNEVTLFGDIFFSPLHMMSVGLFMMNCIRRNLVGVYNLGSRNGMSKKDFALAVAARKRLPTENAKAGVSKAIPGRAPRPKDMRMDVGRIEEALGRKMPTLMEEIGRL